jgi:hypothetical protein
MAMNDACMNGHLELVKWLHETLGLGCTVASMNVAGVNGNFDVFRWLHENRTEGTIAETIDWASDGRSNFFHRFLIRNYSL